MAGGEVNNDKAPKKKIEELSRFSPTDPENDNAQADPENDNTQADPQLDPVEQSVQSGPDPDEGMNLGLQVDNDVKPIDFFQINAQAQQSAESTGAPHSPQASGLFDSASGSGVGRGGAMATDLLLRVSINTENSRQLILGRSLDAMEELMTVAQMGEPFWHLQDDGVTERLHDLEYRRVFQKLDPPLQDLFPEEVADNERGRPPKRPNPSNTNQFLNSSPEHAQRVPAIARLKTEASRETAVINMDQFRLVAMLMDVDQWSTIFSNIVLKPTVIGILYPGTLGTYDGTLQVMSAEFHLPTALVPSRSVYFARYCKQLDWDLWGVVDFSLESMFHCTYFKYQRRPSGCLIQQLPNGFSKVTWLENGGVDYTSIHSIYRPIVCSGFAFGAKRWIAAITRQAEWLQAQMVPNRNATFNNVVISQSGKENLLKLADRMLRTYLKEVNCSTLNKWSPLLATCGGQDMRITTRRNHGGDLGRPYGSSVAFTTSVRLPFPVKKLFNFLSDGTLRDKDRVIREATCICTGVDPATRVSIMQVEPAPNSPSVLYLQNSYSDPTGSYIVYAPIDLGSMASLLSRGNPDLVAMLPSGFAILPEKPTVPGGDSRRSLLTVTFHIVDVSERVQSSILPSHVADGVQKIISGTVDAIRATLQASIEAEIVRARRVWNLRPNISSIILEDEKGRKLSRTDPKDAV